MNQRSKLRVPSGAKARSFCGLGGTAKAVPCPKPIYEMASSHPVIRQMHAVRSFVDEYGDRSIRAGVRNMPRHFLHDERITDDQADHPGLIAARGFTYDGAVVKLHKRHQSRSA